MIDEADNRSTKGIISDADGRTSKGIITSTISAIVQKIIQLINVKRTFPYRRNL